MSIRRALVVGAAVLLSSTLASAQTLGEVARKEEARRKDVKAPAKTYTNDSLRADPNPPSPPPPAAASTAGAANESSAASTGTQVKDGGKPAPAGAASGEVKKDAGETKKDEAYWKGRLTDARASVDRSRTFADALQSRINALTADFSARSDPAQRDQIAADRQKALTELDRVRKEIQDGTKAIADIQEEARKAGAPAGWAR